MPINVYNQCCISSFLLGKENLLLNGVDGGSYLRGYGGREGTTSFLGWVLIVTQTDSYLFQQDCSPSGMQSRQSNSWWLLLQGGLLVPAGPGKRTREGIPLTPLYMWQDVKICTFVMCAVVIAYFHSLILPRSLLQHTQTKPPLIGYIDSDEWNLNYMILSLYLLREWDMT